MKRSTIVTTAVIAILIVVGAVAVGMHSRSTTPSASGTAEMSSQAQHTNKVIISNFAFAPMAITITAGTTVTWTNQDSTTHTVVAADGQVGPKSGSLAKGNSYDFTFKTAGTYHYLCSIHPAMVGTVIVR